MRNLLLFVLLFSSCANTTPTIRRHSATGLPRMIDITPPEMPEDHGPLIVRAGWNYGVSWTDTGDSHENQSLFGGALFQGKDFRVGITPFLSMASVTANDTTSLGTLLSFSMHFQKEKKWSFSPQVTYAGSSNADEDSGCKKASWTLFGYSCDESARIYTAKSYIAASELGLYLDVNHRLNEKSSLHLVPAIFYTNTEGMNSLETDPSHDFRRKSHAWNPALHVYYSLTNVSFGLGVNSAKSFDPNSPKRKWLAAGNLGVEF